MRKNGFKNVPLLLLFPLFLLADRKINKNSPKGKLYHVVTEKIKKRIDRYAFVCCNYGYPISNRKNKNSDPQGTLFHVLIEKHKKLHDRYTFVCCNYGNPISNRKNKNSDLQGTLFHVTTGKADGEKKQGLKGTAFIAFSAFSIC